jgi:hypothetical protein
MPDPDQMSREELLAARERVTLQIERLSYRGTYGTIGGDPRAQLRAELDAMLQEIDTELAELGSKRA